MSAQPAPRKQYSAGEIRAFQRRDFAQQLDFSSLILQFIGYPTKRHRDWVCAVQGLCGGKTIETEISHAAVAERCGYKSSDSDDARSSFARREIKVHEQFKAVTGRAIFDIERGGAFDGDKTKYTDYLTPAANWAMAELGEAMKSEPEVFNSRKLHPELWKRNETDEAILKQRQDIYARMIEIRQSVVSRAAEMLPKYAVEDNPTPVNEDDGKLSPLPDYQQRIEDKVISLINSAFDGTWERGGSPLDFARRLASRIREEGHKAERTCKKVFGDAPRTSSIDYQGNTSEKDHFSEAFSPDFEGVGNKTATHPPDNSQKTQEVKKPKMGASALSYAGRGKPIFPLHYPTMRGCSCSKGEKCKNIAKHPLAKYAPNGFEDATLDPGEIGRIWADRPDANIGMPTGKASGVLVLDVDPRHGGDASIVELFETHGSIPETLEAETGGGGTHLYFEYPSDVEIKNSVGFLGDGLDIRGSGGYMLVAPSLHASGKRYRWRNNLPVAPLPQFLKERLTAPPEPAVKGYKSSKPGDYSNLWRAGGRIPEGQRHNILFRKFGCSLRGRGAGFSEIYSALLYARDNFCDAGADPILDDELEAMAHDICRRYPAGVSNIEAGPVQVIEDEEVEEVF